MKQFNKYRAFDYVYSLSKYHRVQGSDALLKAAQFIFDKLNRDDKQLIYYNYDGESRYGNFTAPMGWDPIDGGLYLGGELLISYEDAPLFITVHSPPGYAEGLVVTEPSKAEGKILLTPSRDAKREYIKAAKAGASGVIFYSEDLPSTAIPYRSLFLKKDEMNYSLPAVSIPKNLVNKILDKNVTIRVSAKREPKKMPVIYAGTEKSKFLITSHMCHPFPGANDNASGAGLALELANAGAEADFLWIPEHYGSMAFFSDHSPSYELGINLDMVGENQKITGSTLQVSYTPFSQKSPYEEILKAAIKDISPSYDIRYKFVDFDVGSDHAVLVQNGIPAVSLTNWPDLYYHSSEDFVDKVSTEMLDFVGKGVLNFLASEPPIYLDEVWKSKYKAFLLNRFGREDAEKLIAVQRSKYRNFLPVPTAYLNWDNVDNFPNSWNAGAAYLEYSNLSVQLGEKAARRLASIAYGISEEDLEKLNEWYKRRLKLRADHLIRIITERKIARFLKNKGGSPQNRDNEWGCTMCIPPSTNSVAPVI